MTTPKKIHIPPEPPGGIFISAEQIRERAAELAADISRDYEGRYPRFVVVLKGAFRFASDLLNRLTIPYKVDFIGLRSYQGTRSTGFFREYGELDIEKDEDVIILEDIVDSGRSIQYLKEKIDAYLPKKVDVCTLLYKKEALVIPIEPSYVGFEIPNKFLVGYGLDLNEKYRDLPDIHYLED